MMNITKVTTTTIITNPTTRMETKEVCLGTMMGGEEGGEDEEHPGGHGEHGEEEDHEQ